MNEPTDRAFSVERGQMSRGPQATVGEYFRERGFLPVGDPARSFPSNSEYAMLDEIGRDLPSMLEDAGFRHYARTLKIPVWRADNTHSGDLPLLRLYYVRTGFLASAYVNHVGEEPAKTLPYNLAAPLCSAAQALGRPPILSYDGYALYNWKRFDLNRPIELGNIDTLQNFVHLYDEHWFILIHVAIEALAARILDALAGVQQKLSSAAPDIDAELSTIATTIVQQTAILRRIPEKMDPTLYYKTFRPYIRFFEDVSYETSPLQNGDKVTSAMRMNFRGETGAQSSIMPTLVAFMKIPHKPSMLTNHLLDMRRYMPAEHRGIIEMVEAMPRIRVIAGREAFNAVLDAMAEFRSVHFGWAQEYINRWTDDPRGTGGTPYMKWLEQLIAETRAFRK